MQPNPIIWDGDMPIKILYKTHSYDVLFFHNATERNSVYAFVKREDARYGLIEVHGDNVFFRVNSKYDALFYFFGDKYVSIDQCSSITLPIELDSREEFPLCFVSIGVNGLLTCSPVLFYDESDDSTPLKFYPNFVCEYFNDEYFYLCGCVYYHKLHRFDIGKGWYKEYHEKIHYDQFDSGYNNFACYQYERDINSSIGKWLIVDDFDSEDRIEIKGIKASSILYVDLWRSDTIIIGTALEGREQLLIYDKKPSIELRDSITCAKWRIYEMEMDSLIIISRGQSVQLYSEKKGFLSEKHYRSFPYRCEPLVGKTIPLTPVDLDDEAVLEFLKIGNNGELFILQTES